MGGTHPGLARALQRGIPILEFGVCQYGNRGMRFNNYHLPILYGYTFKPAGTTLIFPNEKVSPVGG